MPSENSTIAGTDSRRAQLEPHVLADQRARPPYAYSARTSSAVDGALAEATLPAAQARARGRAASQPGLHVVGDHDPRPAREQRLDQRRGARVQPGERLVEQQHLGRVQHARGRPPSAGPSRARTCAPGRRRAPAGPPPPAARRRGRTPRRAAARGSAGSRARSGRGRAAARGRGSRSGPRTAQPSRGSACPSTGADAVVRAQQRGQDRSSVVLPAPLAPNTASVSPSSTVSDTPESATRSP